MQSKKVFFFFFFFLLLTILMTIDGKDDLYDEFPDPSSIICVIA